MDSGDNPTTPVSDTGVPTIAAVLADRDAIAEQLRVTAERLAQAEAERVAADISSAANLAESNRVAQALRDRYGATRQITQRATITAGRLASMPALEDESGSLEEGSAISPIPLVSGNNRGSESPGRPALDAEGGTFQVPAANLGDTFDTFDNLNAQWAQGNLTGMPGLTLTPVAPNPAQSSAATPVQSDAEQIDPLSTPPASTAEARHVPTPPLVQSAAGARPAVHEVTDEDLEALYRDAAKYAEEQLTGIITRQVTAKLQTQFKADFDQAIASHKQIQVEVALKESQRELQLKNDEYLAMDPTMRKVQDGSHFQDTQTSLHNSNKFQDYKMSTTLPSTVAPPQPSLLELASVKAGIQHRRSMLELGPGASTVYTPVSFKHTTQTINELNMHAFKQLNERVTMHNYQSGNKPVCGLHCYDADAKRILLDRFNFNIRNIEKCQAHGYEWQAEETSEEVALYYSGPTFNTFMRVAFTPVGPQDYEMLIINSLASCDRKFGLVGDSRNQLSIAEVGIFLVCMKEKITLLTMMLDWYKQYSLRSSPEGKQVPNVNFPGVKPRTDLGLRGVPALLMSGPGFGITTRAPHAMGEPSSSKTTLRESIEIELAKSSDSSMKKQQQECVLFKIGRIRSIMSQWETDHKSTRKLEATFTLTPARSQLVLNDQWYDRLGFSAYRDPAKKAPSVSKETPQSGGALVTFKRPLQDGSSQPFAKNRYLRQLEMQNLEHQHLQDTLLRASYEYDGLHDADASDGAHFDDDGYQIDMDRGRERASFSPGHHVDSPLYQQEDTSVRLEEQEPHPVRQSLMARDYEEPLRSDHRPHLSNLDARDQRHTDPRQGEGRPSERFGGQGRGDARESSHRAMERHDPRFSANSNPRLVSDTRARSPGSQIGEERKAYLKTQPCDAFFWSTAGCSKPANECLYSHDAKEAHLKYSSNISRVSRILEEQVSKRSAPESALVPHSAAKHEVPPRPRLQLLRRPESRGVTFGGSQYHEEPRDNAHYYAEQLALINQEHASRLQQLSQTVNRPTYGQAEEELDGYLSSGGSSAYDA